MLENEDYATVVGNPLLPYYNSLAASYGLATDYFANVHPSIGDYFMLTTGQIVTVDDNFSGVVSDDNLVRELVSAGKTWKAYVEDLPSVGFLGELHSQPYQKRHNPFAFFSDVVDSPAQQANLVPLPQLAVDLAGDQLPNFAYILGNRFHTTHDCPNGPSTCSPEERLATADSWLKTVIPPLLGSAAFQRDGLLLLLFDEATETDTRNGGGQVALVVVSPKAKPGFQSTTLYQHQSALRLILESLGISVLPGAAATAPPMNEFFVQ
jgi:phosphatidylinositol-3-phosphatase